MDRDSEIQGQRGRAGLGLHPQLVAERHTELALWESYLTELGMSVKSDSMPVLNTTVRSTCRNKCSSTS
jgi:hypothetical protein